MMNSRLPLVDIAAQCGFADQSGLNRSFKRIHGLAPGTWRRREFDRRDLYSLDLAVCPVKNIPRLSDSSYEKARRLAGPFLAVSATYSAGMARLRWFSPRWRPSPPANLRLNRIANVRTAPRFGLFFALAYRSVRTPLRVLCRPSVHQRRKTNASIQTWS